MKGGYGNLMSISGACDVKGTVTQLFSGVAKEPVSQNLNSVEFHGCRPQRRFGG